MALSPEAKRLAFYYPAVQSSVSERASTADVFSAVRSALAQAGATPPSGLFKAVNELRSAAVQERNFAASLGRQEASDPILGSSVPQAIFARSGEVQAMNPLLQVDYQVTHRDQEGNLTTSWATSFNIPFTDGLTKSDLVDLIGTDAEAGAARYGKELVGDPVLGAVLAY